MTEVPQILSGEVILCLIVSNSAPLWQKPWKANAEWHTSNCVVSFDVLMHAIEDLPFITFASSMGSSPDSEKYFSPDATQAMKILFAAWTHSLVTQWQWPSCTASSHGYGSSSLCTRDALNFQPKKRRGGKSHSPVLGKNNWAKH